MKIKIYLYLILVLFSQSIFSQEYKEGVFGFLEDLSSGAEVKALTEKELSQTFPGFMIDHSGFDLPQSYPFSPEMIDLSVPVYPMFPMYETRGGLSINKGGTGVFKGVVIPAHYLGLNIPKNSHGQVGYYLMLGRTGERNIEYAVTQVKKAGLHAYVNQQNGNVYGLVEPVDYIKYGHSESHGVSVGLNLDFLFKKQKKNVLDFTTYQGVNIHLDPLQTVNSFFDHIDFMQKAQKPEEIIQTMAYYTPYLQYYMHQKAYSSELENSDIVSHIFILLPRGMRLPADFNAHFKLNYQRASSLTRPPNLKDYSSSLRSEISKINKEKYYEKEKEWSKKLWFPIALTPVYNNQNANRLVQQVCDYLSEAYTLPQAFWPRCRISASLQPNAYAYPGGDIFITAGLIGILSKIDSLALILAHEIGHVASRHTTKNLKAFFLPNLFSNFLTMSGTIVSMGGGGGYLGAVNLLNWFPKTMASAFILGFTMTGINTMMMVPLMHYQRGHEWQADSFGQQTAFVIGAKPKNMEDGWKEFYEYVAKYYGVSQSFLEKLLASHPPMRHRLGKFIKRSGTQLTSMGEAYQKQNGQHLDALRQDYQALNKKISPFVIAYGEILKRMTGRGANKKQIYARESLLSPSGFGVISSLGSVGAASK